MDRIPVHTLPDVLAAVRYRFGFTPADSLVVVGLSRGGIVGVMARIDRTQARQAGSLTPVIHALTQANTASLFLIWYTEQENTASADLFATTLNNPGILKWRARQLWASPTHYRAIDSDAAEVLPIADVDSSTVAAAFTAAGIAPLGSREDLARAFDPAPTGARRAAATARTRWTQQHTGTTQRSLSAAYDAWHAARTAPRATAYGHLAAAMANKTLRDHLMVYIATGERPTGGAADVETFLNGEAPSNSEDVRGAVETLIATAAHNPGADAANPLSVAGFLKWWLGEGGAANVYTDAALERDTSNTLAQLTNAALSSSMPPPWTHNR